MGRSGRSKIHCEPQSVVNAAHITKRIAWFVATVHHHPSEGAEQAACATLIHDLTQRAKAEFIKGNDTYPATALGASALPLAHAGSNRLR
jgi:hypothetical protein